MTYPHFILTRFNVMLPHARKLLLNPINNDPDWLAHRFDLFERYCHPSVCGQVASDFIWIILCDAGMPAEFRTRIEQHATRQVLVRWITSEESFRDAFVGAIRSELSNYDGFIITTRLDNDDAINRRFTHWIQKEARSVREFLNFDHGLAYSNGRLVQRYSQSNPFLSFVEPASSLATVFAEKHDQVSRVAPIRQLSYPDAWLQVIHERNVANRLSDDGEQVLPARNAIMSILRRSPVRSFWKRHTRTLSLASASEQFSITPENLVTY